MCCNRQQRNQHKAFVPVCRRFKWGAAAKAAHEQARLLDQSSSSQPAQARFAYSCASVCYAIACSCLSNNTTAFALLAFWLPLLPLVCLLLPAVAYCCLSPIPFVAFGALTIPVLLASCL